MLNHSIEKKMYQIFTNMIDNSKENVISSIEELSYSRVEMTPEMFYEMEDEFFGLYYNSLDEIMKTFGSQTYARFKFAMAAPDNAMDGVSINDLLELPYSYLPVWVLYMVACYSITGKSVKFKKAQPISHYYSAMVNSAIDEVENNLRK